MSRIGWWLRWATSGSGEGGVSPAEAAGGIGLETRSGADGWEVVVPSAPAAAGAAGGPVPVAVCDGRVAVGGPAAEEGGGATPAVPEAVAIEVALERAASGTVWEEDDGGVGGGFAEDDADTGYDNAGGDDNASAAPQNVSPNVPRSFRDTLMAGAGAGFSDPKAFSRSQAAAARSPLSSSSSAASSPTIVDGGEQGGAVFLWRKAAAGQGECRWYCRGWLALAAVMFVVSFGVAHQWWYPDLATPIKVLGGETNGHERVGVVLCMCRLNPSGLALTD